LSCEKQPRKKLITARIPAGLHFTSPRRSRPTSTTSIATAVRRSRQVSTMPAVMLRERSLL
jgi:hypothetical protein